VLGLTTDISATPQKKLYRLWAIPLILVGVVRLIDGYNDSTLHHLLLGAGMLLMGLFAFRHNLLDLSPKALSPAHLGTTSMVLMASGVLLVLTAAVVALAA